MTKLAGIRSKAVRPASRLIVAAVMFTAALGCRASSDHRTAASPSPTGNAQTIANLDAFDPIGYFALWHGDVSLPGHSAAPVTEAEWQRLVSRARVSGMESMNRDDRLTLVQGALKAYVMSVSSTERTLTSSDGHAHVYERYSKHGELYTLLAAREQASTNLGSDWPDFVSSHDGSSENRLFVDIRPDGVGINNWTRDDAVWQCIREDSINVPFGLYEDEYLLRLLDAPLAGTLVSSASFAGRDAISFEFANNDQTTYTTWLDTKTLFPIGFDYPAKARHTLGPPVEVRIDGINVAHEIEVPPGTCE